MTQQVPAQWSYANEFTEEMRRLGEGVGSR